MNSKQSQASEIFLAHYDFVMRAVFYLAPFPDIVDDIIQDTFKEFVLNADRFDLESDPKALLKGIAKNIALRHWQQRQRERSEILQKIGEHYRRLGEGRELDENDEQKEWFQREQNLLELCLERLTPKSREVIRQHYYQGKSLAEIAAQLQATVDGTKQLLFRIRRKLRQCIDKYKNAPRSER